MIKFVFVAIFGLACLTSVSANAANKVPDRIVFKVGSSAPGSSDLAGRIVAKHFEIALEAKTGQSIEMMIENVPAAEGLVLLKQTVLAGETDGSVIAFSAPLGRTVSFLANNASLDFDPTKLEFIGAVSQNVPLCLALKDKTLPPEEGPFRIGYLSKGGIPYLAAKVASLTIGGDVELIGGFKNLQELPAALERNEIDAYCGLSLDTFRREKREKQLKIIYKLTDEPVAGLESTPSLLAKATGDLAVVAPLLLSGNRHFHMAFLPPGINPEILETYRAAFADLALSEAFKKDMAEASITLSFATGEEVDAYRQNLMDRDPADWKKAYDFIAPSK